MSFARILRKKIFVFLLPSKETSLLRTDWFLRPRGQGVIENAGEQTFAPSHFYLSTQLKKRWQDYSPSLYWKLYSIYDIFRLCNERFLQQVFWKISAEILEPREFTCYFFRLLVVSLLWFKAPLWIRRPPSILTSLGHLQSFS